MGAKGLRPHPSRRIKTLYSWLVVWRHVLGQGHRSELARSVRAGRHEREKPRLALSGRTENQSPDRRQSADAWQVHKDRDTDGNALPASCRDGNVLAGREGSAPRTRTGTPGLRHGGKVPPAGKETNRRRKTRDRRADVCVT